MSQRLCLIVSVSHPQYLSLSISVLVSTIHKRLPTLNLARHLKHCINLSNLNWHEPGVPVIGLSTPGNDVAATAFISHFLFIFGASVQRSSGRRSGDQLLAMT